MKIKKIITAIIITGASHGATLGADWFPRIGSAVIIIIIIITIIIIVTMIIKTMSPTIATTTIIKHLPPP